MLLCLSANNVLNLVYLKISVNWSGIITPVHFKVSSTCGKSLLPHLVRQDVCLTRPTTFKYKMVHVSVQISILNCCRCSSQFYHISFLYLTCPFLYVSTVVYLNIPVNCDPKVGCIFWISPRCEQARLVRKAFILEGVLWALVQLNDSTKYIYRGNHLALIYRITQVISTIYG